MSTNTAGAVAPDQAWKNREQGAEAAHAHSKEQEQLQAIRARQEADAQAATESRRQDQPHEGGYGGQEELEDRYATTSGEH
ncbi:hypothetical protein PENSPDRAFT_686737 [Peniophora sp. CONT]|nr:hypothetical protein PENSPDRAFT_686737 [Peniophora sp. CONT]